MVKKKTRYNPEQLRIGRRVEMEHTRNPKVALRIAKDHLREFPDYYTYLRGMEKFLKHKHSKKKV